MHTRASWPPGSPVKADRPPCLRGDPGRWGLRGQGSPHAARARLSQGGGLRCSVCTRANPGATPPRGVTSHAGPRPFPGGRRFPRTERRLPRTQSCKAQRNVQREKKTRVTRQRVTQVLWLTERIPCVPSPPAGPTAGNCLARGHDSPFTSFSVTQVRVYFQDLPLRPPTEIHCMRLRRLRVFWFPRT